MDHLGNLLCCLLRLLRELPHILCDDGKSLALFTGTRCLNGCIECQEIRLLSDGRNRIDDLADFIGAVAEDIDEFG